MKITPDVICLEFIGIKAKVVKSSHNGDVGISGKVIGETKNTFTIMHKGKEKMVAKDTAVFHFGFSDGAIVEILGKLLTGRSEDRLKKSIRRLW